MFLGLIFGGLLLPRRRLPRDIGAQRRWTRAAVAHHLSYLDLSWLIAGARRIAYEMPILRKRDGVGLHVGPRPRRLIVLVRNQGYPFLFSPGPRANRSGPSESYRHQRSGDLERHALSSVRLDRFQGMSDMLRSLRARPNTSSTRNTSRD